MFLEPTAARGPEGTGRTRAHIQPAARAAASTWKHQSFGRTTGWQANGDEKSPENGHAGMGAHLSWKSRLCPHSRAKLCMQHNYWSLGRGATGVGSGRYDLVRGSGRIRGPLKVSQPYEARCATLEVRKASSGRRTWTLSHSLFLAASSTSDIGRRGAFQ